VISIHQLGATVRLEDGTLAAVLVDPSFEDQMTAYLKSTQEWAPLDRPPPAERHFIRKKRRAAFFEARGKGT
jgi:hypothetical protein